MFWHWEKSKGEYILMHEEHYHELNVTLLHYCSLIVIFSRRIFLFFLILIFLFFIQFSRRISLFFLILIFLFFIQFSRRISLFFLILIFLFFIQFYRLRNSLFQSTMNMLLFKNLKNLHLFFIWKIVL